MRLRQAPVVQSSAFGSCTSPPGRPADPKASRLSDWMIVCAAVLAAGLVAGGASASSAAPPSPPNCPAAPAIDSDFPDPGMLERTAAAGEVFAYATNASPPGGGALMNLPVARSGDDHLSHWSPLSDAMPRLPAWARASFTWAPAPAHRDGGPYRLYFTARYGFSGRSCIGVAVSDSPVGPFKSTSELKPLVCPLGEGGAIDPSVFREDDGSEYLLWKTDSNCCDGVPTIFIEKLASDGLSLEPANGGEAPWLLPDAVALIHRDEPWEGRAVEAPTLRKHDGRYFLFYSANDYASDRYAVSYASAQSLLGPYKKKDAPILSTATSGLDGPGGQDIFTGPDGETWIAFHAWRDAKPSRVRALFLEQIAWEADGPVVRPKCADPTPVAPPAAAH